MAALGAIVLSKQEGGNLPSLLVTRVEKGMDALAVLDETIGGSTRKIRKATSRLPDSVVTGEHRLAYERVKLVLSSLGVSRSVWKEAPLRANMLARDAFHLVLLKEEVERVVGRREDPDVEGAMSFFRSKLEVAERETDWREAARQLF